RLRKHDTPPPSAPPLRLALGGDHTCEVEPDGSARCWGDNDYGQLGDGTKVSRPEPAPVTGLKSIAALAAGYRHTCAALADGSVWCWGRNDDRQLGVWEHESHLTPTRVAA